MDRGDLEQTRRQVVDDRGQTATLAAVEGALRNQGRRVPEALIAAAEHPEQERVTARYGLANGSAVVLESQGGEFRVRSAPPVRDCPATVQDALHAFRTAVATRPGPASAAPLTRRARLDIAAEKQAILQGLRYLDELEVFQVALAAQVTLPSGHDIRLRSQQGCWRIDEVN